MEGGVDKHPRPLLTGPAATLQILREVATVAVATVHKVPQRKVEKSSAKILSKRSMSILGCDNGTRKRNRARRFESVYDLIGFLGTTYEREPISHPVNNGNSGFRSTTSSRTSC
jgi:hypothetical protein